MQDHTTPPPAPNPHPLRWLPEFWGLGQQRLRPQVRMMGLSLLVGVVAGFGAIAFYIACQLVAHYALGGVAGYQPHHPGGEPPLLAAAVRTLRPWWLLVVPIAGGLFSGLLVYKLAPEAEGHGTDAAIAAFHEGQGVIRPRVPLVKLIASAVTIGTGGSGGREGPIAQIGAGFGSLIGKLFHLQPAQRRILMAAGVGAGVAAIFRAPLAGALFAAEILYRSTDFESDVIVPAALASTAAYCTFGLAFGWSPLFTLSPEVVATLGFKSPSQLLAYLMLALFMAALAMLYTRSFYGLSRAFGRLPLPRPVKPAVGAFGAGLVAVGLYAAFGRDQDLLAVLSSGYGSLQGVLSAAAPVADDLRFALVLLVIALGKILTTGLTIGSGGSGGVFGPSMVIGGCGGGALGLVLRHFWPTLVPHPASFVIVGMAGFFAAAAKTPISTLVIVSEMTGNYSLLLPALWVCTLSFLLSDEQSLYRSQVASRSLSPAHRGDYVRDVLVGLSVGEFLAPGTAVATMRPQDRLPRILERLNAAANNGLPVTTDDGDYLGMLSLEDVHLAARSPSLDQLLVAADLMCTTAPTLRPDDSLDKALEMFVLSDRTDLAVLDREPSRRVVGIVRRVDISSAYLRRVHGEPGKPV